MKWRDGWELSDPPGDRVWRVQISFRVNKQVNQADVADSINLTTVMYVTIRGKRK